MMVWKFGERLRAAREAAGITLDELSKRSGVGPSSISEWERGESEPGVYKAFRVAGALGVTIDFLCGVNGPGLTADDMFWRQGLSKYGDGGYIGGKWQVAIRKDGSVQVFSDCNGLTMPAGLVKACAQLIREREMQI